MAFDQAKTTAAFPIISRARILLTSVGCTILVFAAVPFLQWLVYDDWLHRTGPLRVIGTIVSSALTFVFVYSAQSALRQRQLDTLRRFQVIARMNDRIRNSLQAIACVTYMSHPEAMEPVQEAATAIDGVLREVLLELSPRDHSTDREREGYGQQAASCEPRHG